jgi:predicted O-linked N-acetylglucosamine transferase (SPINDLY family)
MPIEPASLEAIFVQAKAGSLDVGELFTMADLLINSGREGMAVDLYDSWLAGHPDNPTTYAVCYNFALLLTRVGDPHRARQVLERSIALKDDYIPAQVNLGMILEQVAGRFEAACQWIAVAEKFPQLTGDNIHYVKTCFTMIGRVLQDGRNHARSAEAFRRSLDLDIDQPEVVQQYVSMVQQQCSWPVIRPWTSLRGVSRADLLRNINPLTLAIYADDPFYQLGNAFHYAKGRMGEPKISFAPRHGELLREPAPERLRIGYLSAELRNHAGGFLMAELFELHDRQRFEIFTYNTVHAPPEGMAGRIQSAVEHSVDISAMSDEAAAKRIFDDKIHILIDMQAHTYGSRLGVLAMRPAPVIANWLGFPGSAATAFHNYLIADAVIVPPEFEIFYSEKIARLPCYQPNDRKRVVSEHRPSRADMGLPEDAMVYCAFNGQHKITPFCWRRWMTILREVDNSLLWLLETSPDIDQHLRNLAVEHGIAADRVHFANRIGNADHLARYPLADLFLDTAPYGAHTTASDAMWMGVPILTLPGRGFASRVCASILSAAGLPELIAASAEDYVRMAIDLGRNREKLTALRDRLKDCRTDSVLFDTPLLTSRLEDLFEQMWEDYRDGKQTRPDLTNLDLYRDIGIELDADDVEMLSVPDYFERYRQKLAERSFYSFVPPDGRLVSRDRH